MKKVCIIEGHELKAREKCYPVVDDFVIRTIRSIKQFISDIVAKFIKDFNIMKGYKLCVCKEHLLEYNKKRTRFERNILLYSGIALFSFIVFTILPFFSRMSLNISSLISSIFLAIIIFLFSFLSYMPRIDINKEELNKLIKELENKDNKKNKGDKNDR